MSFKPIYYNDCVKLFVMSVPSSATPAQFSGEPDPRFNQPTVALAAAFLTGIGITTEPATLQPDTFLSGLMIQKGALLIDEAKLAYPGDILHEAGHLAVLPVSKREALCGNVGDDGGEEMAAIAWSYAAALHLGIDPAIVFHSAGYKGGAQAILTNFSQGCYIGVPYLAWLEMTLEKKKAALLQLPPYPHMLKWVNDRISNE
jgi:hypothetical protein